MSIKVNAIDLSFFTIALKEIGNQSDPEQFAEILDACVGAKEKGKLDEYLDQAYKLFEEGSDLASAFHYAFYDIVVEPGDKI